MADPYNLHLRLSWKKRLLRFRNTIENATFPVPVKTLPLTVTIVSAIHYADPGGPYDLVSQIPNLFRYSWANSFTAGLSLWLTLVFTNRLAIRLLLLYKGYLYENQNQSLKTKLWALALKVLLAWRKPKLYSFQGLLPKLPVPKVEDTVERYLKSMRPLLKDEEYDSLVAMASDFKQGIAPKLQRYLQLKYWWSNNYVSDWWEKYAYHMNRAPLLINSNVYGVDLIFINPCPIQSARAAFLIYGFMCYREVIENQQLEPIVAQGIIPICSAQSERYFNTARIPGLEIDEIVHYEHSEHMVVYHKGKYFLLPLYHNNRLLKPCEIEIQIQAILDDESSPCEGEEKLAALTAALNRTEWAKMRQEFFGTGINKQSLTAIESAALFVSLDEVPYEDDKNEPEKLSFFIDAICCGNGHNRWCDKSLMMAVGTNGKTGLMAEHSWADGPVSAHGWEYVLSLEWHEGYREDGHTKGTPEFTPPSPVRLKWECSPKCVTAIEKSSLVAKEMIAALDLYAYIHDDYGKGFMKKAKVSPDAYIQMALQLAYFRDAGRVTLTYEATMTRLFREGRTETLRSCTPEMVAWVKAMEDPNTTVEEKYQLMLDTATRHKKNYQDAMSGKGVDRHLFGLYVVSKYLQLDSPFLKEVFSQPWKLSTSQTPQHQCFKVDYKKHPEFISGGVGFGPVDQDGYGVSYNICGEDLIIFHISSKHTSTETDSRKFAKLLKEAFADMKNLMLQTNQMKKQNL